MSKHTARPIERHHKTQPNEATERLDYFSPWLIVATLLLIICFFTLFPNPVALAVTHWPLIILGVVGAIIGNITAIGGGIVFIPAMLFFYQLDPMSALKLSFVTQAVGMSSGASGWLRRGEVPLALLTWTLPGLVIGSMLSTFAIHPNPLLIKGLFGPIACLTGLLTLLTLDRKGTQRELPATAFLPTFFVALLGGMITGWVAIGEGELIAAFCMLRYGLNANRAIGLGVVLLAVNSGLLAVTHAFYFGGVPWELAFFTMLGVLWGGRLGPYLAQKIRFRAMKKLFALIALLDGLMVTLQVVYTLLLKN